MPAQGASRRSLPLGSDGLAQRKGQGDEENSAEQEAESDHGRHEGEANQRAADHQISAQHDVDEPKQQTPAAIMTALENIDDLENAGRK